MTRLGTRELLELLVDPGSYVSWDGQVDVRRPLPHPDQEEYDALLDEARLRSGTDESVHVGEARVRGHRTAILAGDFAFLAGSIGVTSGERVAALLDRARHEHLPVLALPVSGGTRMQEGSVAFVQMVKAAAGVRALRASGLPFVVYLRDPTTGGVFATWGSMGQVTYASPDSLIGFLGPRVFETIRGAPFPPGVQVSQNLARHGLVDEVVPPERLADKLAGLLSVAAPASRAARPFMPPVADHLAEPEPGDDPWRSVQISRDARRPGVRDLLALVADDVTELYGTGEGEPDAPAVLLALAHVAGVPAVVLGQDRDAQRAGHPLGPVALRKARRGMHLAVELGLPLVSVVDTPGAELSRAAEEGGLAGQIARCLGDLMSLHAPTLSFLLGEGSGGGALAMLPADRVVCAEHAWLSPIAPEGAAAILHRTAERAPELARHQRIASWELRRYGIVDRVVPECPSASEEPTSFLSRAAAVIATELVHLVQRDAGRRVVDRMQRWRHIGTVL